MAINFLGVGSGLDLQTMLTQLVEVATKPKVEQLGKKEAQVSSNISGLGSIKSALSSFQDAVNSLKSASLFGNNTASVTQPASGTVVSVSADSSAVAGTYDITVEQLSKGSRLTSDNDMSAFSAGLGGGSATLSFDAGAGNSFSITVDDGDDIATILDKVNGASDNFGVSATMVDGNLVYKSTITGLSNQLAISNDNIALDSLSTIATGPTAGFTNAQGLDVAAQNAKIKVDGIDIESANNSFEGKVTGLTITALQETEVGETANLSVGKDTVSIATAIKNMASSYNKVMESVNKQRGSKDDEGNFVAGPMFGESILRQVQGVLSDAVTSVIAGANNRELNSMYAVGLDLQSDGTLAIDEDRMADALVNNFDDFSSLFTGDNGFATTLSETLESYLKYDGVFDGTESSYKQQMDDIEEQYSAHISYVTSYKEMLTKQFASLDSTIATLNATRDYMTGQLAQLSKISGS